MKITLIHRLWNSRLGLLLLLATALSGNVQAQIIDDVVAPALADFQPLRLHSSGADMEPHSYWLSLIHI